MRERNSPPKHGILLAWGFYACQVVVGGESDFDAQAKPRDGTEDRSVVLPDALDSALADGPDTPTPGVVSCGSASCGVPDEKCVVCDEGVTLVESCVSAKADPQTTCEAMGANLAITFRCDDDADCMSPYQCVFVQSTAAVIECRGPDDSTMCWLGCTPECHATCESSDECPKCAPVCSPQTYLPDIEELDITVCQ